MKLKSTLLIIFILLAVVAAKTQSYVHSIGTATYQDITAPTYLNGKDSIPESFYLNVDFTFPVFGAFADFKFSSANKNPGLFVAKSGYIAVYEGPGYKHTHVFAPYYSDVLVRRDATSSVGIKLSGNTGNRVLQLEWKNMGLAGHTSAEFVNFQLWFDEATKQVSYHYGSSNVISNPNDVNIINFFRSTNDASPVFTTAINLTGNAAIPTSLTVAHPTSYNDMQPVTNFPPSGTVITYKAATTGITKVGTTGECTVYPNPVNGLLTVQMPVYDGNKTIEVYDLQGALIVKNVAVTGQNNIDLTNIATGIYILKIVGEDKIIDTKKIIKQ